MREMVAHPLNRPGEPKNVFLVLRGGPVLDGVPLRRVDVDAVIVNGASEGRDGRLEEFDLVLREEELVMVEGGEDDPKVSKMRTTGFAVDKHVVIEYVSESSESTREHERAKSMDGVGSVAIALLHDPRDVGSGWRDEARLGDGLGGEPDLLVRIFEVEFGPILVRSKTRSKSLHVGDGRETLDGIVVPWLEVDDETTLRWVVLRYCEHRTGGIESFGRPKTGFDELDDMTAPLFFEPVRDGDGARTDLDFLVDELDRMIDRSMRRETTT
jgi:hypothetical protein